VTRSVAKPVSLSLLRAFTLQNQHSSQTSTLLRLELIMPLLGEEICTRFSTWRERTPDDPLVRSEYDPVVWRGGLNLSAKQHSLITNNRLQGMGRAFYIIRSLLFFIS